MRAGHSEDPGLARTFATGLASYSRTPNLLRSLGARPYEQLTVPGFARMIGVDEIEKNEFNLNIPRYIDSMQKEDRQDIAGHLLGGIPVADIDALEQYWNWVRVMSMRSGQPGINGIEYAGLHISLPPAIEEQFAIAQVLSDMDAEI